MSDRPKTQSQLDLAAVDYRIALQRRDNALTAREKLNIQMVAARKECERTEANVLKALMALTDAARTERCEEIAS